MGDVDRVGRDLGRNVPIADMPDQPLEGMVVGGPDLQKAFGRGFDPDEAPVLKHQGIAVVEHRRFGEIEEEGEAAEPPHGHAATMAVAMVEDNAVDDLAPEDIAAQDVGGADHGHEDRKRHASTHCWNRIRRRPD